MSRGRLALATFAAFLVSQVLAIVVHGVILAADYGPFYGSLLRAAPAWQMILLPVAHLAFIAALVWVYVRVRIDGTPVAQGVKLGLVGWTMGQVPHWLLWYAEQPWPDSLVVKQLALELLSSLLIGVTIALVARQRHVSPALTSTA